MAMGQNEIISRGSSSLSSIRRRAFNIELYNQQKENILVKKIKVQLNNAPQFLEELQQLLMYLMRLLLQDHIKKLGL